MSFNLERLEVKDNLYYNSVNKVTYYSDIKDGGEMFAYDKSCLIIDFGGMQLKLKNDAIVETPKICLMPAREDYFTYTKKSGTSFYMFPLGPLGFYKLTKHNLDKNKDVVFPLSNIVSNDKVSKLYDLVSNSNSLDEVNDHVGAFLKEQIGELPITPIDDIVELIQKVRGQINFNDIVDKTQYSERTLNRYFKKYIGMSPALFIRLVKFNALTYQLYFEKKISEIVKTFDFYDQTHLTKDFIRFANIKPSEYLGPHYKLIHELSEKKKK